MSDLIQKSGSASAAESYGAYCTGCIGGSSANSSVPFVLPDYEEEKNSGGGYNPPDGSLSDQYDLMRHLDSDRTTCGDAKNAAKARTTAKTSSATSADSAASLQEAPSLSSSRALFASNPCASQATGASNAATAAKNAETGYITGTQSRPATDSGTNSISHSLDGRQFAYTLSPNGTTIADTGIDMKRTNDAVERFQTGPETGLVGTISVMRGAKSETGGQDGGSRNKRENPQDESGIVANAGALSVMDESGTSTSLAGDAVEIPRMQQISNAILEQMERMTADSINNSVNLKLDMADGSKLALTLRWRGNHVKASFDSDSASLRGEIENGWASLSLNVGNSGMQLEPPAFGENTTAGDTGYYA